MSELPPPKVRKNPWDTVNEKGRQAALEGAGIHACPYRGQARKSRWLAAYMNAQQIDLVEECNR